MSTALLRNQISKFKRLSCHASFRIRPLGCSKVITHMVAVTATPDDELLLEFINSLTFEQLYTNELFKERLINRLKELEAEHIS